MGISSAGTRKLWGSRVLRRCAPSCCEVWGELRLSAPSDISAAEAVGCESKASAEAVVNARRLADLRDRITVPATANRVPGLQRGACERTTPVRSCSAHSTLSQPKLYPAHRQDRGNDPFLTLRALHRRR